MKSPASILSPKKRKRSDNHQDVTDTEKLQEKMNKKYKSEEEVINVSISSVSNADEMSSKEKKKKKKKNKEQEEEELHILSEDSVNGSKKKKKQKEIVCAESVDTETADQQGEETDCVLLGITTKKKKKKKKKTQEQDEEKIHNVPEESVIETTNQHAGETDSGLSLEINSRKKKKKKEKRQEKGEEEIYIVPEESGPETRKKIKEKQTLWKESVDTETAEQNGGETEFGLLGINKKEKRKEKEEIHAVEEDSVIEDTDPAVLAETNNVKKKKKKKKRKLEQEEDVIHSTEEDSAIKIISETNGVKKRKRKRRKQEQEEIHTVEEEDSVIENLTETTDNHTEDTDPAVLAETNSTKKKKKRRRGPEQEEIHTVEEEDSVIENLTETTGNHAKDTVPAVFAETNCVKKKKKRRQVQEEIHTVEEEDCVIQNLTETTDNHAKDADPAVLAETNSTKKKKKRRRGPEQEEIHTVEEEIENLAETTDNHAEDADPAVLAETDRTKKKKKRRRVQEEIYTVEEEDSVIENLTETMDNHAKDADPAVLAETNSTKKKKKRRRGPEQEEIHTVEEEDSVIENLTETMDNHAEDTDPAVLAEANSTKKMNKRRKGEQVGEEMHSVEHQNNTECLVSVGTQMEVKKIQREKKASRANISNERTKKVGGNVKTNVTTKSKRGQQRALQKKGQRDSPADDVFDSKLLDELEQFVPNIRKQPDSKISRLIRLDLPRFKQFKKEGIPVRTGRFTEEENQRIRKNVADFKVLIDISSDEKIVFPEKFKEEEREIKRLKLQHTYVVKIAEGIPRTCDQVNCRARKIFDVGNKMGRFSDEEIQTLVKLQNLHGNNWKKISEIMGRSIHSLEKRFSTHSKVRGAWGADEESRLKKALRDHLEDLLQQDPESSGLSRDQLCDNLPWMVISQKVKTRHWTQCRLKWFSLLKTKLGTAGNSTFKRGSKARQAKIRLINTLHNMGVEDPAEIDWHEVAEAVGDSTPVCIQKTFLRLKRFRVPQWPSLSFGEIIDFLHGVIVPSLEKGLNNNDDDDDKEEEEEEEQQQQEKIYQLSDVFG